MTRDDFVNWLRSTNVLRFWKLSRFPHLYCWTTHINKNSLFVGCYFPTPGSFLCLGIARVMTWLNIFSLGKAEQLSFNGEKRQTFPNIERIQGGSRVILDPSPIFLCEYVCVWKTSQCIGSCSQCHCLTSYESITASNFMSVKVCGWNRWQARRCQMKHTNINWTWVSKARPNKWCGL